MSMIFDKEYVAEILRGIRKVAGAVTDQTRDSFGDPFDGRLTDGEYCSIADTMEIFVNGYVLFKNSITLIWTQIDGRLRFELIGQSEHYAAIRAAVNEYFKQMGLVDGLLVH